MKTIVAKLHGKEIGYLSDAESNTVLRQYKGIRVEVMVDEGMNVNDFNTMKQLIRDDLKFMMGSCVGVKYHTFGTEW